MALFMDGIQLPQDFRATARRQFTFYYYVLGNSWYFLDLPQKDESQSQPWSHPVILSLGPLY